jgi:hypothetical protein
MPRLSLWRPEKGNDYKFFDRRMSEMFTVGGTDILVHKYLGPISDGTATSATEPGFLSDSVKNIQDLLFLENRDRKYDTSVYQLRALYRMNDNDFDLTQFGLFLTGDTLFMTFHLNDMVETLGRKLIIGDVLEVPHLKDLYPLDDGLPVALKQYFVVQDSNRSAEGFAPTWYGHLWRIKVAPLVDSQEYKDIIAKLSAGDNTTASIQSILSTYDKYIAINDAVVARAEQDVPKSGYDTSTFYTEPVNPDGSPVDPGALESSSVADDASDSNHDASAQAVTPIAKVEGYLTGDGLPPNGGTIAAGITFPQTPGVGDYFLRLDYVPNRLFRFDGRRWAKIEDAVRTTLTPGPNNQSQLSSFINDTNVRYYNALAWDAIRVANPYTPEANAKTISFTLSSKSVVTKVPYVSTYGVRSVLNGITINNTISNVSGNVGFTLTNTLIANDIIEYTVYANVRHEPHGLSVALRPIADN